MTSFDYFTENSSNSIPEIPEKRTEKVTLKAQQMLFRQGELSETFYIIETGQIQLYFYSKDHQKIVLQTLKDGEVVGELPFVENCQMLNAIALCPTTLLCLKRDQFWEFFDTNPHFKHYILQLLCQRDRNWSIWSRQLIDWIQLILEETPVEVLNKLESNKFLLPESTQSAFPNLLKQLIQINLQQKVNSSQAIVKFKLEIDEEKRQRQVEEITQTEYFESLIKFTEKRHGAARQ